MPGKDAQSTSSELADASSWDARYGARGPLWSGRPNGRLVQEVVDLVPGCALDVGCGEGADAIWLAQRGWTVSAIDHSAVALERAREAARLANVGVDWILGDALNTDFDPCSFELVSMQYPALPRAAGDAGLCALLDTVRPGGVAIMFHDIDDEHRRHMSSGGNSVEFFDADDLLRLCRTDFTIEVFGVQPRVDPPPGSAHVSDIVLRARRNGRTG